MHSKRIGHLDVKPENVLAASDGSFKLGDLGHATLLDSLTMTAEEGDRAYLLACMPDDFARDIDLASPPPGSLNGKSPRYPLPSMIDALLGQSPSSDCSTCGLGHGQGGMSSSSAKKAESESNGMMSDGAALGEDDEEVPFSPTAFSRRLERAVRADSSDHNSTNNNAMDDSCASSEGQHEDGGAAAAAAAMAASSASASSPVASSSFDRGPVPPPTPMSASSARMSSGNPPHGAPAAPFSAPSSGGGRSVTAPDSGPFSEAKGPATAGRAASPPFFGQSPMPGGLGHGMTPQSCATTTNGTPFSDQSTNSAQSNTSGNNSTGLTQAFSPMGFDSVPFGSPPPAHLVQTQFPSSAPQPMPHAAEATTATTNTEGATAAASSGAVNMGAGDSADIHGSSMKPPPTPFHRAPSSHNRHDTSTGGVGIGSSGVSLVGQEWHSPPEGAYGYGLGPAADVDPQRAATNRAVYLCAADVFALGLCAYEVARMAEVPDGYIVPTNGNEYSDLREGAVPPFERQDMTVPGCCFGVAYENAVKDVLAPRSYQDRPTAQQLLDTFEALEHYAPITGEGASPANSPTTALSGGGAAALGSSSNSGNPANGHGLMVHPSEASLRMPPPQLPPGHSTPSLSELERLRARVRQLEAALAAAAGQGGGV
jgi:serine/threonine protein kinase